MASSDLRFDGRVAVITGAGRGLGREFALLLADRGATVVVNNRSGDVAHDVVDEITSRGGSAVACESDVRTRIGAEAPVAVAIDRFGRVDVVINNAGTCTFRPFPECTDDDLDQELDVHLRGSWMTTQAAWPHMARQGHGRVLMICSRVMMISPNNATATAAKGALLGLSYSLAAEGKPHGINVNALSVAGFTRLVSNNLPDPDYQRWMADNMPASAVAPAVAWLVHEDCRATGEFFSAWGRGFSRLFLAETPGYVSPSLDAHTPEAIRDHFDVTFDPNGQISPTDGETWAQSVSDRLGPGLQ